MKTVKIVLTLQDTFSFAILQKTAKIPESDLIKIRKDVGKVIAKNYENGINYEWKLKKVEMI